MSIEANIAARRGAEEMIDFIGEQSNRYWECLIELAADKLPPKPEPVDSNPPFDERQAINFEAQTIPYGKYAGTEVGQVDCGYLLFLTEGDAFSRNLRRYVRSKRFQDRQQD